MIIMIETVIIQFLLAFVILILTIASVGKILAKIPPTLSGIAFFAYLILTYTFIAPWIMAIFGM